MSDKVEAFYRKLEQAVKGDLLLLPTLPEIALQIREKVEEENCSVRDIANLLARDGALSAQLIRIANSPLYRARDKLEDLQVIINRLGMRLVKDLVISIAIRQTFMPTSQARDKHFRAAWAKSVEVAAISRMLAMMGSGLKPEQALLAGLIHNIGVLPILVMAEQEDLFREEAVLEEIIQGLQGRVGRLVLQAWDFPEYLLHVVTQCYDFQRHCDYPDYVDLVQVALIQGGYLNGMAESMDMMSCTAFHRLNLDPSINMIEVDENQAIIEETRDVLLH